jgi:hypothetical protein
MAPMTSGLLLVYEIPDAGGRGHRLLIPEGCDIPADEAAALIASIRGPVHLAADRLGVVRPSTQRTRGGAVRDSSVVAAIAGINVTGVSSGTVVSALATLEDSLDGVVAEAAGVVSVNDAPVIASHAAAKVLDSIVALGFRDASPTDVAPAVSIVVEQRPRPGRLVADMLLLTGTLVVLAAGGLIGWFARDRWPASPTDWPVTDQGHHEPATEPDDVSDNTRPPDMISEVGEADRPIREKSPLQSSGTTAPQATPERGQGAVQEHLPEVAKPQSPSQLQPTAANTGTAITFFVECEGIAPNEQIQLVRCDSDRPIGLAHVATADTLSFTETATDGIDSPEQLKVSLREVRRRFGNDPPPHVSEQFKREPAGEKYSCVIAFTPANAIPRRITVTVTPRKSAD